MAVRRLLTNVGLAIGALLATVLGLELVLQLAMPVLYRPRVTKIDPVLGWYHQASVSTQSALEGHSYRESYNADGYRSPDHTWAKPPGSRRVVVLGDSFVDGSEVGDEELLTWQLQQSLGDVEVVNLGVYGYATAQELVTLETVAFRYEPDLVVLVTVPNDFPGNLQNVSYFGPAPRYLLDGDSLRFESTASAPARSAFRSSNLPLPGMRFLHERSLLYYFLNHSIYQRINAARIDSLLKAQSQALEPPQRAELYRRIVRKMKEICDARGVGFLVVLAYEKIHLGERRDSTVELARRLLHDDGIAAVDLYPALRQAHMSAGDSALYYVNNIHWTPRGHRAVASFLRPHIDSLMRSP